MGPPFFFFFFIFFLSSTAAPNVKVGPGRHLGDGGVYSGDRRPRSSTIKRIASLNETSQGRKMRVGRHHSRPQRKGGEPGSVGDTIRVIKHIPELADNSFRS